MQREEKKPLISWTAINIPKYDEDSEEKYSVNKVFI